ncbi:branched-chain amino acid ABC transporter permease [Candidatus Uhrbacteria bacterium]|nr:branched-chain amino acid ABC transporter permease [Candidatus Uhrbacteria bacterium]
MTLAFNLSVGYAGLLNLGHVGLVAVGAYTSALTVRHLDWPVWLGIVAGSLLAMTAGAFLALPARKIKGDYYALLTLGFMFVMSAVLINWDSVTRGTLGVPGIPRPGGFQTNVMFLLLVVAITIATYFVLARIVNSPFGRALEAVRDDEEVAMALGKPVFRLRLVAMAVSGLIAGLAGALLAHFVQFISPNTFWLDQLVWVLAGMVIGGLASMPGAVVGSVLLFAISEPLRFLPIPSELVGPLRLMIFMAILLAFVLYRPKGLMGRAQLEG